jgi:hypothetical protein
MIDSSYDGQFTGLMFVAVLFELNCTPSPLLLSLGSGLGYEGCLGNLLGSVRILIRGCKRGADVIRKV